MRIVTIDGQAYTLADPLDGAIQQQLVALVKAAEKDPLAEVVSICKDLPPEVQTALLKDAMDRKYGVTSLSRAEREAQQEAKLESYVASAAGMEAFLCLLWRRHHPDLTVDKVWQLHGKACQVHGDHYFELPA